MAQTAAELVAAAKQRVEALSVEQVAGELASGGALLVDLRESWERVEHGAIPGAVHVPSGMLEFWADPTNSDHRPEFDPARRVILHCASGGRSALGADTLRQLGYSDVAHLDGGFTAWKGSGQPVEEVQPPEGLREAQIKVELDTPTGTNYWKSLASEPDHRDDCVSRAASADKEPTDN